MATNFLVTVVDKSGKTREFTAQVMHGVEKTAEELAQHYQDTNHFPGAKSITIQETDAVGPSQLSHALKRHRPDANRPTPAGTPKANIGPTITIDPRVPAPVPNLPGATMPSPTGQVAPPNTNPNMQQTAK